MADVAIPINFAIQSYKARSGLASAERVVNLYAEENPPQSGSKVSLFRTPGVTSWKNVGINYQIYGMIVVVEDLYVVCGVTLFKIDTNKVVTNIGSMPVAPGRVMMTENGTQVTILVESGLAWYYDIPSTTFAQITDGDYQLANSVTTLDGYTIFTKKDSQTFFWSQNLDTRVYAALDNAAAAGESDNLTTCLNYKQQLILLGTRSTEIWYDTGNNTIVFQRIDGALIKKGTNAKYTAVADVTGVYWLGNDKIVYNATNYSPQRISTYGVEKAIESYATIDDAYAFIYVQEGHRFYCLTFPSEGATWVYDVTTGLWHERESLTIISMLPGSWIANNSASFNNVILVGDRNETGEIYELDLENKTENGRTITWLATSATQFDNYKRLAANKFILWMNTGVGIDGSGQGSDPEVMMKTSVDGGKTWSNELWMPIGEIGSYLTEVWWDQVDFGRNLLIQISGSDPVVIAIIGAFLELTQSKP